MGTAAFLTLIDYANAINGSSGALTRHQASEVLGRQKREVPAIRYCGKSLAIKFNGICDRQKAEYVNHWGIVKTGCELRAQWETIGDKKGLGQSGFKQVFSGEDESETRYVDVGVDE